MAIITIDNDRCIGCGECAADCVAYNIEVVDGKARLLDNGCIGCGHCYAICPTGAVGMPEYSTEGLDETLPPESFDSDRLLLMLKSRRSVRRFTSEPVTDEEVAKLLEAGRYSPTGTNLQLVHFAVMRDPGHLAEAEREAMQVFKTTPRLVPLVEGVEKLPDGGAHFFLRNAPMVIIIAANHKIEACIAATHLDLLAQSMGLGVYYNGYFTYAAKHSARLLELCNFPEGISAAATLVIGHPEPITYYRLPPREPVKVTFC